MLSGKANYRFYHKNTLRNSPRSSESSDKESKLQKVHHVKLTSSVSTRLKSAGEARARVRNALAKVGKKINTLATVVHKFKAQAVKDPSETTSPRNDTLQRTRPFSSQAKYQTLAHRRRVAEVG